MRGHLSANVIFLAFHILTSSIVAVGAAASHSLRQALVERAAESARGVLLSAGFQVGPPTESESTSFLVGTLRRFRKFALASERAAEARHEKEEKRLKSGAEQTKDEGVRFALGQSITSNQQSLAETERIYGNMVNFSDSMLSLLSGATSKGFSCEQLGCGAHASCTETMGGAQCVCLEGYVGQGQDCRAPPEFLPHRLLGEVASGAATRAADLDVSIFELNKIAIVFRDVTAGNAGRILVGKVREAGLADLATPELFTAASGKAFSPVVVGTPNRRLAVAWRDEDRRGTCWLRAAALGTSNVRGAEMALSWGEPVNFCTNQAHKMSLLAFPDDRVVVMYADKARATQHTPVESFGNSLVADITGAGAIAARGNYRFTDYPVARLEATKVTPTAFVLAARAGLATDEFDPSVSTRQEAMAVYGELVDGDLAFNPNPVNIEPEGRQIWSRGVSLIAPNTVAYAYQDGASQEMKVAVVEINPVSHHMQVIHQPSLLRHGISSPYVSMLSVPYSPSEPHSLTYYQGGGSSMVNLCSWSTARKALESCEDFMWLNQKLSSVSGVHLGGGKSFMVFTPDSGIPYYGVFGLSKK